MDIHSPDEPDNLNEHLHEPGDPDGLVAAENQRKWREGELASPAVGPERYGRKRRWPVVLSVFAALALLAVGAYYLGVYNTKEPIAKKKEIAKQKDERKFADPVVATKHYDSVTHTLSLDYPQNWIVADTDAKITITSPNFAMQTNGQAKPGHVLLTIQNQQSSVPGYPAAGALASMESQKLTYKQPSAVQRAQTYLSFVGYGTKSNIDALYLTGDNGYQAEQNIPMTDVAKGNPLISVTFVECAKSFCTGGEVKPLTLDTKSWPKAAYRTQVTNLLESLIFN